MFIQYIIKNNCAFFLLKHIWNKCYIAKGELQRILAFKKLACNIYSTLQCKLGKLKFNNEFFILYVSFK